MEVRTHTFNGRKYHIEQVVAIEGVTDVPGEPDVYDLMMLNSSDIKGLHSALHEGLEAVGCCDCIHRYDDRTDDRPVTWDVAKFLWRLGWRRTE
jgi:hypothetical protein